MGSDGGGAAGARVSVWWELIRDRALLGECVTDATGAYKLDLAEPDTRNEPRRVLLRVTAIVPHPGKAEQQLVSPLVPAAKDVTIDLAAGQADTSELAAHLVAMAPALGKLSLAQLEESATHTDLSYLAAETDIPVEEVLAVALAARLSSRWKLPPAAFYAFLRLRVPPSIPSPLLPATDGFEQIDALLARIGADIIALAADVQRATLATAIAEDLIPQGLQADTLVAELQALRGASALDQPYGVGTTPLRALLATAKLATTKQAAVADALAAGLAPDELGAAQGLSPDEAGAVSRTLELGSFADNAVTLVAAIDATLAGAPLAALATWSEQQWDGVVAASGYLPPDVQPEGGLSALQTYAGQLAARAGNEFPAGAFSVLASGAAYVAADAREPLVALLAANPDFDLRAASLTTATGLFANAAPGVLAAARAIQRMLRVSPDVANAHALLGAGFTSATQIVQRGRAQFLGAATVAGLTPDDATQIFAGAELRYAQVVAQFTRFHGAGRAPNAPTGPFGGPTTNTLDDLVTREPLLATLFGPQDHCAVDDCTSLLSPAAYVCDLLLWLRNRTLPGGKTAKDALFVRRPDLGHLLLNCANTDTALPYIDLVIELLEDAVAGTPSWRQTTRSADELRAAPEYTRDEAYPPLATASYPFALPYDRATDELRATLAQSGVALWRIREAIEPLAGGTLAQQTDVAAERFELCPHERDLVVTSDFAPLATVWGTTAPVTDLANVASFLAHADVSYEQLLELLEVRWLGTGLSIAGADDSCDPSKQTLVGLTDHALDRAHRFLRLWRRAGWQMWELDLLLRAPRIGGGAELDALALVGLGHARALQGDRRLAVDALAAWFGDLDTDTHLAGGTRTISLFARTFADPSLPVDQRLDPTALTGTLADRATAVRAGLRLSAADFAALAALTDGALTLANLSLLYRATSLAAAAQLSVTDLLRFVPGLAGAFDSVAGTRALLDRASALRASTFTLAQALYVTSPATTLDAVASAACLAAVAAARAQVHADVYENADPPEAILARELAQLPAFADASVLAMMLAIADGSSPLGSGAQAAFLAANLAFLDGGAIATLSSPLGSNPADPAARQAEIDARCRSILDPLAISLTEQDVIAAVASARGLPADVTAALLRTLDVPGTSDPLLAALTDPAPDPDPATAIALVDKIGVVVRQLRLGAPDVAWLVAHGGAAGGLDLQALPVLATQPAQPLDALLATVRLVALDRQWTAAPAGSAIPDLFALVAAGLTDDAAAQAALAAITGASLADVAAFTAALGATIASGAYATTAFYDGLRTLLALAAATRGTGAEVASWAASPPTLAAAATALAALSSRYAPADWLAVAPKRMDPIRDRRSAALAAFLLAQTGAPYGTTQDDLFSYFLIDTQMSHCEVTTRVVQAYAAIQLFVQRCRMQLEPSVPVDLTADDGWAQWSWMERYRVWEANREIFLYPENYLVETARPDRTELMQSFTTSALTADATSDHLELVAGAYLDGLDAIAHLTIVGFCTDPETHDLHVIGSTPSHPPRFFHRVRGGATGAWSGWAAVTVQPQALQVLPVVFAGHLHLFWLQMRWVNEPQQTLPAAAATPAPSKSTPPARHVELQLFASAFRNDAWQPPQQSGTFFDAPLLAPDVASSSDALEAQYLLATRLDPSGSLLVDVRRIGIDPDEATANHTVALTINSDAAHEPSNILVTTSDYFSNAVRTPNLAHLAVVTFAGRFSRIQLANLVILIGHEYDFLFWRAVRLWGPDAQTLELLDVSRFDQLVPPTPLVPSAGAFVTVARSPAAQVLQFPAVAGYLAQGPILSTARPPYRILAGSPTDPVATQPFYYQDKQRAFFVPTTKKKSLAYPFERAYHPYTRLFWHQLGTGGFPTLFDPQLQEAPDTLDPAGAFSFAATYAPVLARTSVPEGDAEQVDFGERAAYGVYNWELFYHLPLAVAEQLAANQQFEDALDWYHYLFDPSAPGPDPVPLRYWRPKPLRALASTAAAQDIATILASIGAVDSRVDAWRSDPFDPYGVAVLRPVAFMKRVVMSYLDTLLAWADSLFATDSREALNEATLLYVLASELLGPDPQPVVPPRHADASYDDLEPKLDAFANALVEIESFLPGSDTPVPDPGSGGLPAPQTFYFKIPPNEKLLGYWTTIADRLTKLRHCQNLAGETRSLALFDAPIDPALLVRGAAAGVDLGSMVSDIAAALPAYRFATLYTQAQDFCGAVRAYGALLLSALSTRDTSQLAVTVLGMARDLQRAADQTFQWRVDAAQTAIDAAQRDVQLAQQKHDYNTEVAESPMNLAEVYATTVDGLTLTWDAIIQLAFQAAAATSTLPGFLIGSSGFGGTPVSQIKEDHIASKFEREASAGLAARRSIDKLATMIRQAAAYELRGATAGEARDEAQIQIDQATIKLAGLQIALESAQLDQTNHAVQNQQLEDQLAFWRERFTGVELYQWMATKLAAIYFQSYKLAYDLAKRAERAFRYELGLQASSYVQFGYWDSTRQGLLAGESLNHDLRRMQAAYLEQNVRRLEVSRFVSLAAIAPDQLATLLATGTCHVELPEALFDGDYPGHYQRRIFRASVTVVYPNPGKTDNVKCTLTLLGSSVRLTPELGAGYARTGADDPRFTDSFGAVQRIVTGNAQNDPGLFLTAINTNLTDTRYLPFEGAGVASRWQLDLPARTNELDLGTVTDVQLHLYYTALDGGEELRTAAAAAYDAALGPASPKAFSVATDFAAAWTSFFATTGADQVLTINAAAAKFPAWTRGKTIAITGVNAYAIASGGGGFVIEPVGGAAVPMSSLGGAAPLVASATLPVTGAPGAFSFKVKASAAADYRSLTAAQLGDLVLAFAFTAT
ncbi:MAG TPA: neuraminidase-like domain-containing protein [Kofleriaceae bacterium]